MATISLHEYVAQVEALLKQESYEQVVTLCQHALRSYPKCVDFYRMLGQACLESDRPDDAADMFRRVLGADPQNFVARVGLGVVAEGIGALDEALWQWDRALELEPHNAVVREEWRRVRMQRDRQTPPARAKLNRTALGYVYLRGEQYDRAAAEFRTVLSTVPKDSDGKHDRFDLQVALAEALYRGGHQREASDLCQQVLASIPNALKPNLILGDIYHESGRDEDAQALFQRAQNIDPENWVANRLLNSPVRLPRRNVNIEEPEGAGFMPLATAFTQSASVNSASTVPLLGKPQVEEAPAPAPAESDANVPDWLKVLRAQTPAATTPSPAAPVVSANQAPDWLKELGATSLAADAAPEPDLPAALPPPSVEEIPPALDTTPASESPAVLPDWLRRLRGTVPGSETSVPAEPPPAPSVPEPQPVTPVEDAPHWLANLRGNVPTSDQEPATENEVVDRAETTEASEPIPTWLSDLRRPAEDAAAPVAAVVGEPELPIAGLSEALPTLIQTAEESTPETPAAAAEEPAPVSMSDFTTEPVAIADALVETVVELPAEPAPELPIPVEPPPAPVVPIVAAPAAPLREAASFLDDSSAPLSIETQVAPTGDNAHRARLELARVMKDIDAESALGLYEMMDGANDTLRQQAIADVSALLSAHPRAQDVLDRLRSSDMPPVAPEVTPAAANLEGVTNIDDAAMPPSLEAQIAPVGEGQYAARLDLARMLIDLELDSALDQYEQMKDAGPELLRKAVDDVAILVVAHPESRRAEQVLDRLQQRLPQPVQPEPLPAATDEELDEETVMPPAPAEPPAVPVVAAESLEDVSTTTSSGPADEEQLIVDAAMADVQSSVRREPARAPMGTAQFRARLDLARALKFIDVDAALNLYELMVGSNEEMRAAAIGDLESLVARYPRAAGIIDELRGTTKASQTPASALPDWLVEVDTSTPPQGPTAQLEPVVAEEAMEEPLEAPIGETEAASVPIVDETIMEEAAAPADEADVDSVIANAPTAVLESPDALEDALSATTLTAPLVETEAEAQPAPPPAEPAAAEIAPIVDEQLAVEPVAEPGAEPALAESPVSAALETAETPVEPVVSEESLAQPVAAGEETQATESVSTPVAAEESIAQPATLVETPSQEIAQPEKPAAPAAALVLREGSEFLSDASAPASIESQEAPTGAAEHQARLELARALREVDIHEGAGQYKSLVDDGVLLDDVIADLQGWLQLQPNERVVRVLLAEALSKAGRFPEAVEQYRLLV